MRTTPTARRAAVAAVGLTVVLGLAGCSDAADTDVDLPEVDVPETIGPDQLDGDGEG